ncbi:hypothetical protein [Ketogulonicigenium vulgare]|uniref:hypothetical protein n=1 Tax=Ketogulonicigenium vulgare TaxID=92945 RepID=UPI0020C7C7DF|nr:hypothetical protein [Ketogulonicigenium vulgare]
MKPADEEAHRRPAGETDGDYLCAQHGIEELHAGTVPVTHTGDYSDVFIIDADGRQIPWSGASHLDDDQMRNLMQQIVDRLYTFHLKADDSGFRDHLDRWLAVAERWDEPHLDKAFVEFVRRPRS